MSLIDDARRDLYETIYADDYAGTSWPMCRGCGVADGEHDDGCVVLRIVAALAAAEAFITMSFDRVFDVDYSGQGRPNRCRVCFAEQSPYESLSEMQHELDCRFDALAAALKEPVPTT